MSIVDIQKVFNSLSLKNLLNCRTILNDTIDREIIADKKRVASLNVDPLVKYDDKFIEVNGELYKGVIADIQTLGLENATETEKPKIQNRWLTSTGKSYTWSSKKSNKRFEHKPVVISNYCHIDALRAFINDKFGSDLNSCLATYYPPGTGLNLHADDEPELDQTQPISVATFGDVQPVEFVKKYRGSNSRADISLAPADGSLYQMLPKCQEVLRHRVKSEKDSKWRVSLSFRRMLPNDEVDKDSLHLEHNFTFSPVKDYIKKFENIPHDQNGVNTTKDDTDFCIIEAGEKKVVQDTVVQNPTEDLRNKTPTTVIFGTSITKNIDEKKFKNNKKKGHRFINKSSSGAKIRDIHQMIDEFVVTNEHASDVTEVIFNFGTNDIKYQKFGVDKHKQPVLNLFNKVKLLFPCAKIFVFSTLPMKLMYRYTVRNFLKFNEILQECATTCDFTFVDCFRHFLDSNNFDINRELYGRDGIHLNRQGVHLLGRWMYYMVHIKPLNNVVSSIPIY